MACNCSSLPDPAVVEFAYQRPLQDFPTFSRLARRGMPWWWLCASHCEACGQDWLVAQEERFNDVYVMRRLDAAETQALIHESRWPLDFDRYDDLVRLGAAAGHSARYADYTELLPIVLDIVRDSPSISPEDVGRLLNASSEEAAHLLQMARNTSDRRSP